MSAYKKQLEKRLFLRYLLDDLGSAPCVWALINERDKRIYIQASLSPLQVIGRNLSDLAGLIHSNKDLIRDKKRLRLAILQRFSERPKAQLYKMTHIDRYTQLGYTIYNKERLPSYKSRIVLRQDGAVVQVVSKGKRVTDIKVFDSYAKAQEYLMKYSALFMITSLISPKQ